MSSCSRVQREQVTELRTREMYQSGEIEAGADASHQLDGGDANAAAAAGVKLDDMDAAAAIALEQSKKPATRRSARNK